MPARKRRTNLYLQEVKEAQQALETSHDEEMQEARPTFVDPLTPPTPLPSPPSAPSPVPKTVGATQVKLTFYLSEEQVAKIDGYIQEFHRQTGVRPNRNDIIRRLVDLARPEDILPRSPSTS